MAKENSKKSLGSTPIRVKVVDARGLDGCKFLIETEDGRRMQAINLDKKFAKDGLKLELIVSPTQGMMSICMAGPMVKVSKVSVIK